MAAEVSSQVQTVVLLPGHGTSWCRIGAHHGQMRHAVELRGIMPGHMMLRAAQKLLLYPGQSVAPHDHQPPAKAQQKVSSIGMESACARQALSSTASLRIAGLQSLILLRPKDHN